MTGRPDCGGALRERLALRIGTLEALHACEPGARVEGMLAGLRLALADAEAAPPVPAPAKERAKRARPHRAAEGTPRPPAEPPPAPSRAKPHWTASETPQQRLARFEKIAATRAANGRGAPPPPPPPEAAVEPPAVQLPPPPLPAAPPPDEAPVPEAKRSREDRAREKLEAGVSEHLIASHTRLPLREVYRIKGMMREERRSPGAA